MVLAVSLLSSSSTRPRRVEMAVMDSEEEEEEMEVVDTSLDVLRWR